MAEKANTKRKGGRRTGAGRKPKAFTTLKRRIETERADDAEYAFALYAEVMRDAAQPLALRLDCANWVSNRVLGLPKAETKHSGELNVSGGFAVKSVDYATAIAALAPRPMGDSESSGTD